MPIGHHSDPEGHHVLEEGYRSCVTCSCFPDHNLEKSLDSTHLPVVKASCPWERGKALTLENTGLMGQGSPRTKPEGLWVSGAP